MKRIEMKSGDFSMWSLTATLKNNLKSDIEELKVKIAPVKAYVETAKAEHTAKGTDCNRDSALLSQGIYLAKLITTLDIKQEAYVSINELRMRKGQEWSLVKANRTRLAFEATGVCTAQ
jgi:hypothetical protein